MVKQLSNGGQAVVKQWSSKGQTVVRRSPFHPVALSLRGHSLLVGQIFPFFTTSLSLFVPPSLSLFVPPSLSLFVPPSLSLFLRQGW